MMPEERSCGGGLDSDRRFFWERPPHRGVYKDDCVPPRESDSVK